jgi:hypothetical protein
LHSVYTIRRALREKHPGACVELDAWTDNLLVHNGSRGFPVARRYIARTSDLAFLVTMIAGTYTDLIAGLDCSVVGVRFYSLDQMRAQGRASIEGVA